MRTGYVPENVTVITRENKEKISSWRFEHLDDLDVTDLEAYKSIVVGDQAKEATLINARNWASSDGKYTETIEKNEPREYRVVNLEIRSEGGRAWKVLDEKNRYYDLREDSLLYSLLTDGCKPGGILQNKLVWGVCDSSIKLIPIDSAIYFKLLETQVRRETKPIKRSELKPGYLYRTKGDLLFIYISPVNSLDISYSHEIKEKLNQQLWYSVYSGRYSSKKSDLDNAKESFSENSYYRYDVVNDKKVVEEIGYVGEANVAIAIDAHKKQKQSHQFIQAECKPIKAHLNHFDQNIQQKMIYAQTIGRYYV